MAAGSKDSVRSTLAMFVPLIWIFKGFGCPGSTITPGSKDNVAEVWRGGGGGGGAGTGLVGIVIAGGATAGAGAEGGPCAGADAGAEAGAGADGVTPGLAAGVGVAAGAGAGAGAGTSGSFNFV